MDLRDERYWSKDGGPFTFDEYVEMSRPRPGESEMDAWDRVHRVALDEVGPMEVSTVALMIDIGFNSVQRFETMVFDSTRTALDDFTERYASLAQAVAGHDQTVARIRQFLTEIKSSFPTDLVPTDEEPE